MVILKKSMLFFAMIMLSGCSVNENETDSSSIDSVQSISSSVESSSDSFPYAVDVSEWTKEIIRDGEVIDTTHEGVFVRNGEGTFNRIVISTKDLNATGQGIYFFKDANQETDSMEYYPIRIKEIPTKEITVIDLKGKPRKVSVNTSLSIVEEDGATASTHFLFYNQEKGTSFAVQNLSDVEESGANEYLEYILLEEEELEENEFSSSTNDELANEYYEKIRNAYLEQRNYRESIADSQTRASVQAPFAAANSERESLMRAHPEDVEQIEESFQLVKEEFGF